MIAKNKNFKTEIDPEMTFISPKEEDVPAEEKKADKEAPAGFKMNPMYIETKTKRVQLLMQPSVYEAVKARASGEGKSVNECIHSILEAAVREGE